MIKNFPVSPQRLAAPAVSQDVEPEYAYISESETVHLRDYWKILVKRRRKPNTSFWKAEASRRW